jgi:hypothetical protein
MAAVNLRLAQSSALVCRMIERISIWRNDR